MSGVVLIDAGGANIGSVRYALQRLGVDAQLSGDAATIRRAERVILPGVGAAAPAMERLRALDLVDTIRSLTRPLLGICLGMQLLFEHSDEAGSMATEGAGVACLGLLPGTVTKLPAAAGIRIPHMGWNTLLPRRADALLDGIAAGDHAYFVHSYAAPVTDDCIATCAHGTSFAAVVRRGRIAGAQFHPERSAQVGARILQNFLRMDFE
ncbi:imidazole glycerol phosphate synthase subunit HisH [Chiayiivirga flava]|uniref:Imidazole glycerol phosphate synthase subunit HisH n=1 Tax=Chiayiivirga flava TaxID=659595 RepID=A0A7W8D616_9GAMM|nr:glutamine amidotransferase [Chiayiivirga flava]